MGCCLEIWHNWQIKHPNTRSCLGKNNKRGTPPKAQSKEEAEGSEEREIAVAEMAKLKHPISCKALTKPPKDQKSPPFT
ncbi:unnamed protein product [Prunus armeniaca]